jgi:hypothetical protein
MDFQYTTKLPNGFKYFVHVNDEHRQDVMNCTLVQVSDRSVEPPRDYKLSEDYFFFKNLKEYHNVEAKKKICSEHVESALAHIREEIKVLSAVPLKSESKKTESKKTESKKTESKKTESKKTESVETESEKTQSTPRELKPIEILPPRLAQDSITPEIGDKFQSRIVCDIKNREFKMAYGESMSIDEKCLKNTLRALSMPSVTGEVLEMGDGKIKFSLKLSQYDLHRSGWWVDNIFTLPYNREYVFWKNYQPMTVTFKLMDAGGGGQCFFFSLYEALKHNKRLDNIKKLSVRVDTKENFATTMRTYLSKNVDYAKFIEAVDKATPETKSKMMESYPEDFRTILDSNVSQDQKIKDLQEAIQKTTCFVSEQEVLKMNDVLKKDCKITLTINNTAPKSLIERYNLNTVMLANINETHYQWYKSQSDRSGGGTRRRLRRSQRRQRRQTKFNTAQ